MKKQVILRCLVTVLVSSFIAVLGIGVNCQAEEATNQEPVTITKRLSAGWNLISMEVSPLAFRDVEGMGKDINAQGGVCVEIDGWIQGAWVRYICSYPANNFDIQEGSFYFVKCEIPSDWKISGMINQIIPSVTGDEYWAYTGSVSSAENDGSMAGGIKLPSGIPFAPGIMSLSGDSDSIISLLSSSPIVADVECGWHDAGTKIYANATTDKVGIGTQSPKQKLAVVGSYSTSGTGTLTTSGTTVTGSGTQFNTQLGIGDTIIVGTQKKLVKSISADGHTLQTSEAFDPVLTDSTFTYQNPVAGFFKAGSSSPSFIVNSLGNVGINTPTPSDVLNVKVASSTKGGILIAEDAVINDASAVTLKLQNYSGGSGALYATDNANSDGMPIDTFGIYSLGVPLLFGTGTTTASERMRISTSGNVGIGTTNPVNRLDLGSSIGKKLAVYQNSSGSDFYGIGISDSTLELHAGSTSTGSPKMVIKKATGNVGIGTTNPKNRLDLGSTLGKKLAVYQISSGNDFYGFGISDSTLELHAGSTTTESPKMVIKSSGNVGIGTTNPSSSYKLHVNGVVAGTSWHNTSDSRLKKDIATIDNAIDKVAALRGVKFMWRAEEFPDRDFDKGKQIGLIAQEVEKVLPEVVLTDQQGYKSVAYSNIVAVLIEAVKTQQAQIAELQSRINALESK